jgi:hypothetical protein
VAVVAIAIFQLADPVQNLMQAVTENKLRAAQEEEVPD